MRLRFGRRATAWFVILSLIFSLFATVFFSASALDDTAYALALGLGFSSLFPGAEARENDSPIIFGIPASLSALESFLRLRGASSPSAFPELACVCLSTPLSGARALPVIFRLSRLFSVMHGHDGMK